MDKKKFSENVNVQVHVPTSFPRYIVPLLRKAARFTMRNLTDSDLKKVSSPFRYTLHISIVTPDKMKELNKKFRNKNKPTDVLSFSTYEGMPALTPAPEIGDVIICYSVARKQAKENKVNTADEMQRLTVHGVLHLFGYDHERSKKDETIMFWLQDKIMQSLV